MVPSSSMEPTLHCAKPSPGCRGLTADHVTIAVGKPVKRGDIIVFDTPPKAAMECGEGSLSVKRIIGLPGDTVREDVGHFFSIAAGRPLDSRHFEGQWTVQAGGYFVVGDNRSESCDSRVWGGVPRHDIIGPVVKIVRG